MIEIELKNGDKYKLCDKDNMKKSINDIFEQRGRLIEESCHYKRWYRTIIEASRQAMTIRHFSRFSQERDLKR